MVRKILFGFLFVLTLNYSNGQNTVGTIKVTEDAYEGYTLFSTHTKSYLVNNCGQKINTWSSAYLPGNSNYLLPNGNLLRTGNLPIGDTPVTLPGNGGIVELFDWDGNLIWSYTDSSDTSRQHHDVFPLPNGNILILAATVVSEADAIQAGRAPDKLADGLLYNERIYEVEPIGTTEGNIVWEWNVMDHVIQDFDASKDNFGVVGNTPGKIDINFLNGWDAKKNWLHINSIQYDEEFDQIVISSRRMSEIWIIDHNTTTSEAAGAAGDFLYRWGNPQAYRQGLESDRKLYGQHTPYYIPAELPNARKLMLFNNGHGRTPMYSQVDIIEPPVDTNGNYSYLLNTAYGPSHTFFSYPDAPPSVDSGFFSAIVSSARQLPNGNILICEGRKAHFFEINSNNAIVWEYISPVNNTDGTLANQEAPPSNNFAFRATKYGTDYNAFVGRDLTPGLPIENNPNITDCLNVLHTENAYMSNLSVTPNPTKSYVTVNYASTIETIELYNINGSKLLEVHNTKTIDLRPLSKGLYFIRAYDNKGNSISERIIKH